MTQDDKGDAQEQLAIERYRQRFRQLREQLGPHAGIVEVEALLVKHENAILNDTLSALTEGVSPPRDPQSDP